MKQKMIAPSMMCGDLLHLAQTVRQCEESGVEFLHIDIMDGQFVPNFTLGTDVCRALKAATAIPLDIHLMVEKPEEKLSWFGFGPGDLVSVHYESTPHICRVLQRIRDRGARPAVALNPGTPVGVLENLLPLIDAVLVMTVNPGFSGQSLIPGAVEKVARVRRFLQEAGYPDILIEVDGNVSFENARKMARAGADIFVAGTSSIFSPHFSLTQGVDRLRRATQDPWQSRTDHIPVVGHRGACAKYPENTMESFRAAMALGVDLIEFDVNCTKDGQLVVIHDNTVDRTSDHTGRVRDYTLEELKTFDFGGEIPTLQELLAEASAKEALLFNVEIKDYDSAVVDKTVTLLREFDLTDRAVIACFNAEVLRYTHEAYPEFRLQGFPGRFMKNFTQQTYDCMFGMGIPVGPFKGEERTDEQVMADIVFARERGILCWLFHGDTPEAVARCVRLGADNITGNDPAVTLATLRQMGLHE